MEDLLIIIDIQEGFRSNELLSIVPNINKLIKTFQGKVVLTLFIDKKESSFEKILHWTKFQNNINQDILKEVNGFLLDRFFHNGYTILNNELRNYISDNKFSRVFLAGIYTDVCIIKAAMDFFDEGIEVKVLANACTSLHGRQNHLYALYSLKHIIGSSNVINISDISLK